jgi:hypothetical protein
MARAYAGTVMLEGTTLIRGQGHHPAAGSAVRRAGRRCRAVLAKWTRIAPDWLAGCAIRECWFEPTFHKHAGHLCNALMIHAEGAFLRSPRVPPVALAGAGLQGDPDALSRLSDLARFSLRVCWNGWRST